MDVIKKCKYCSHSMPWKRDGHYICSFTRRDVSSNDLFCDCGEFEKAPSYEYAVATDRYEDLVMGESDIMLDFVEVIFSKFLEENIAAEKKHPGWPDDPIHAAAILAEESGELTQAALDFYYHGGDGNKMINEAIQCGAMAVRFLINSNQYKRKK